MILLREELGEALRYLREMRGLTLRDVSAQANVALSYLSEVERGKKEASSEVLASISNALGFPLSHILWETSLRLAVYDTVKISIPDAIPEEWNESAKNEA